MTMEDFVITTGVSVMRATVGEDGRVSDSTGGMLTGLTMKQLRHICNSHKWSMDRVNEPEPEVEEEPEPPKKKGAR
jgi:hypothetical protein